MTDSVGNVVDIVEVRSKDFGRSVTWTASNFMLGLNSGPRSITIRLRSMKLRIVTFQGVWSVKYVYDVFKFIAKSANH